MRACHVAVMPGVRRGASSILLRSQLNRTSPQLSYSLLVREAYIPRFASRLDTHIYHQYVYLQ